MAIPNIYRINVDIKKKMTSTVPSFRQGDTGQLIFKVFDNGRSVDLTEYNRAELYHKLPSGETIAGDCEVTSNNVIYNYIAPEMAEVGLVETMLVLYSRNHIISVKPFRVFIYDSMKKENLSYISILRELINEVQGQKIIVQDLTSQVADLLELYQIDHSNLIRLSNDITEAERIRSNNETVRRNDEQTRQSNEGIRVSNENIRIVTEQTRQNNESTRSTSENQRISNENTRRQNELDRQSTFTDMENYVENIKGVLEYDNSAQYYTNNIVAYNGSSFIALQDNIAQLPPILPTKVNAHWQLLAQRGVDGSGAVSSVNGIMPEVDGNVDLGNIGKSFDVKQYDDQVYFTFPELPFYVDENGQVEYVGENGNAGVSLGGELFVWKVK